MILYIFTLHISHCPNLLSHFSLSFSSFFYPPFHIRSIPNSAAHTLRLLFVFPFPPRRSIPLPILVFLFFFFYPFFLPLLFFSFLSFFFFFQRQSPERKKKHNHLQGIISPDQHPTTSTLPNLTRLGFLFSNSRLSKFISFTSLFFLFLFLSCSPLSTETSEARHPLDRLWT